MHYHKEKNHLVIEIDERIQGMTLLEFFHYLHLSKKTIHLLRQNKDYTLNNTYVDYQIILKDKDILSIKAYETGRDFIEEESSLEIIYEDDLLCVVNKPSNLIIHPDDKSKNKMCISKTGKDALTHFKEIKTKGNYTLVKCQIETGRKHQIRVHLNHLHHPIIGDTLYGKTSSMIKRMALHAYCLEFIHPLTYQTIKIECLLPFDMEKIIR